MTLSAVSAVRHLRFLLENYSEYNKRTSTPKTVARKLAPSNAPDIGHENLICRERKFLEQLQESATGKYTGTRNMAKKKRRSTNTKPQTDSLETLHLAQYRVTDEPIKDRAYRRLPASVKEQLTRLHSDAQREPQQAIPELLALKKKYPNIPQIYNYLTVAYSASKEMEKAEATIEENIRKNPDYLFARVNYAEVCMARKEYDKVPEIFDHAYDLQALYPKRKQFHISEFANFMGIMGFYFAKTGQQETAETYNEILQEMASDFPMAKRLNRELHPGPLIRLLKRLAGEEKSEQSGEEPGEQPSE